MHCDKDLTSLGWDQGTFETDKRAIRSSLNADEPEAFVNASGSSVL